MKKLDLPVCCTACKALLRVSAEKMYHGNSVACSCGNEISFSRDMRRAQKQYEYFQDALRAVGKGHTEIRRSMTDL